MVKESSTTINMRLLLPGSKKHNSMRLTHIRKNTVHIRRPLLVRKYQVEPQAVPQISISGKLLNHYGFEVGRLFDVYARKKYLLLIAKRFKYKTKKLSGRISSMN